MRINLEDVTNRANELFREMSGWWKWDGFQAPELHPAIASTQVKAVAQALAEAINHELFKPIVVEVA